MDESTARSRHPDSLGQVFLWALLPTLLLVLHAPDATYAQVATNITPTTIAPLDLGTNVDTVGSTTSITGGARPGSGTNLFHSFDAFTLGTGDVAHFMNDMQLPTNNIFGRVIGGEVSTIDGTLRTNNPLNAADPMNFGSANLWLVNPSGLFLGPNARVEVGGSVSMSTANYLRFEGTALFDMLSSPASLGPLSVAPVAAFGFLGPDLPAPITVQGSMLQVPGSRALSLVGGDITVQAGSFEDGTIQAASLHTPSGQINLASVASAGEVMPSVTGQPAALSLNGFTALGNIYLAQETTIDTSSNAAGPILIRGGQLVLVSSSITASTVNASGGNIDVKVQDMQLIGSTITAITSGQGQAGNIRLDVGELMAIDGAEINASTQFGGGGGDIIINSGKLLLTAGRVNTGTLGSGDGGNITISATDSVSISEMPGSFFTSVASFSTGTGNGGSIVVSAPTVTLAGGAIIITGAFESTALPGDVIINTGHLLVTGATEIGVSEITSSGGFGNAGSITVQGIGGKGTLADTVTLDQGILSTDSITGSAGSIQVAANTINLKEFARISSRAEAGSDPNRSAADITLTASNLTMTGGAGISASTGGAAPAGSITLNVGDLSVSNLSLPRPSDVPTSGGIISTGSVFSTGAAGQITIQGINGVGSSARSVDISDSDINTEIHAGTSASTPGSIAITADSLTLSTHAFINATTSGPAPAGNIAFNVNTLRAINAAIRSQSQSPDSTAGRAGTLTISGVGKQSTDAATLVALNNTDFSTTIRTGTSSSVPADIKIAAQAVTLSNGGAITANTAGNAPAGNIGLVTQQLTMTPDSAITSNAQDGGAATAGKAGSITITGVGSTPTTIAGGTIQAQSETRASAGNITLHAPGDLTILGTTVSVKNTGSGNAGSIDLRAGNDLLVRNSQVSTESAEASGGNIKLTAPNLVRIVDSTLTSSVQGQAGSNGGNIDIDPQFVVIQNSQLLANANAGAGGNITIAATGAVLIDPNSLLSASAGPAGISGSVNIIAPIQVLGGILAPLNLAYSQASLSGDRCAADPTGQFSSFVQVGRDGVPQVPGALSPSPLSFLETLTSGSLGSQSPNPAAARLGLDSVRFDDATRFQFHSACHS